MKVAETTSGTWKCPKCGAKNDIALIKGLELPERLRCFTCNSTGPKLDWFETKKEETE